MDTTAFFDQLWKQYVHIAPGAQRLHDLVAEREGKIINDHVAFRTYDLAPIGLNALEKHVLALGYERFAPYQFPAKKLEAFGYLHPDPLLPRIFLSELKVAQLSEGAQSIIKDLVEQVDPAVVDSPEVMWSGPLWKPISRAHYEALAEESEYAAWMSVYGIQANHFTISVNHLKTFKDIRDLMDFVEGMGFPLNTSGGRVKGSPEQLLEQGSTMADRIDVTFGHGDTAEVPSCYVEFAERQNDPETGKVFNGFVAASADKIFESTDR